MHITELQLANFRNYDQLATQLTAGTHLFFGENGQGKTNLVEAIGYLANFESHRATSYQALITENVESAQLSARVVANNRTLQPAIELNRSRPNRYWLNANLRKSAAELGGVVTAVIFAPEDLDIIRRDPADRRRFLDGFSGQLSARFQKARADYDRVLKQRNALLKSAKNGANLSTLDIWDDQLASLGAQIIHHRIQLVQQMSPLIGEFYRALTAKPSNIEMSVISSVFQDAAAPVEASEEDIRAAFIEALESVRDRELERGISLVGPHRDELLIELNGLPARDQASQGEAWSLALGAKLATAEIIRQDSAVGDPVLILDDVFAVLDAGRRARLAEFIAGNEQVLITSTSDDAVPGLEWHSRRRVHAGEVIEL